MSRAQFARSAHDEQHQQQYEQHQHKQPSDADPSPFSAVAVGPPGHPLEGWAAGVSNGHPLASTGGGGADDSLGLSTSAWDGTRPFSFARRTGRLDWETILGLDLARIVHERDLTTLQRHTTALVYADITQADVAYFEAQGRGQGSGAANALHLFRLWQLQGEAMLHVQAFLLRSLQAKEGAVARERSKHLARVEAERAASAVLKARLGAAQKELKQARAALAGYELAAQRAHLPHGSDGPPASAHYPGEVYTCSLCSNAFSAPHFLAQHYQRRHPNFIPPQQQQPQAKPPREEAKENYQPPRGFDAAALAALRSELTASLEAQFASRRAEDHRRMLARLTALEALLVSLFSRQPIPAHMEPSQRQMYESLLTEIESIKADLARDARVEWGEMRAPIGSPQWNIVKSPPPPATAAAAAAAPAAPAPAPMPLVVPPSPVAVPVEEPAAAARPTPLAVTSPANSNPAFSPSPRSPLPSPQPATPPPMEPSQQHGLSRADRIGQVLLARSNGKQSWAPFPELSWLASRYGPADWTAMGGADAWRMDVERRADELMQPENASFLAALEAEMHALPNAADSYNAIHASVESRAAARPLDLWIQQADEALDARHEFLPVWEQLVIDKERRQAEQAAREAEERERAEQERMAREAAAEREAAAQRVREAHEARMRESAQEEKQQEHERMLAEQQRVLQQYELARQEAQLQQQQRSLPPATTSTPRALAPSPSSASISSAPSPASTTTGGYRSAFEGAPRIDTSSPSHANQAAGAEPLPSAQAAAAPGTGQWGANSLPLQPAPSPYTGHHIMTRTNTLQQMAREGIAEPDTPYSRPEGWGSASTPLPTIMPRASAAPFVRMKTPLAVAKPPPSIASVTGRAAQPLPSPAASVPSSASVSPSSSFSSAAGSSFGYGGASIMARSAGVGPGGLTHISEGGSFEDSGAAGDGLSQSRRASLDQEAKYDDERAAMPAPVVVIPRTHVDEEFEQLLSPKRVGPRTQPPLASPAPSPSHGAQGEGAGGAAMRFMVTPESPQVHAVAGLTVQPSPQPQQQPQWRGAPLLSATAQPGASSAFNYGAPTPGPGWASTPGAPTPGPGAPTPGAAPQQQQQSQRGGVHVIGGHGFNFGHMRAGSGVSHEASEDAEAERLRATERARREEEEAFGVPSSFSRTAGAQAQSAASENAAAGNAHMLNDSLDETIHLGESRAAYGQPAAAAATAAQPQQHHAPNLPRMLSPSNDQLRNEQAQHPGAFAASRQSSVSRTGEITPGAAHAGGGGFFQQQPLPSPTSVLSQPGLQDVSPPPVVSAPASTREAFGRHLSVPGQAPQPVVQQQAIRAQQDTSMQGRTDVQAFVPSPAASFRGDVSSAAVLPFASSVQGDNGSNTVESFHASQSAAPGLAAPVAAAPAAAATIVSSQDFPPARRSTWQASPARARAPSDPVAESQPTFVSDLNEDDFARSDARALQQQAGAEAVPAPSHPRVTIAVSPSASPATAGVIAPGSVSSARAQLQSSGFFPMSSPMHLGGGTPNMAALKAAKAAREASEAGQGGMIVEDFSASPSPASAGLVSPTLTRAKSPASRRSARTALPTFSPK